MVFNLSERNIDTKLFHDALLMLGGIIMRHRCPFSDFVQHSVVLVELDEQNVACCIVRRERPTGRAIAAFDASDLRFMQNGGRRGRYCSAISLCRKRSKASVCRCPRRKGACRLHACADPSVLPMKDGSIKRRQSKS